MKRKTKSLLLISLLVIAGVICAFALTPKKGCKCGSQCKCDKTCKCGEHNGTGVCDCGPKCTCPFPKKTCKCGPTCDCRKNNPSGECKCGPNCKCGMNHDMMGMNMNHENIFLRMMDTMMMEMDVAPLDVSAEGNFLRQMIPHHQGAIAMAKYEIAHGKNKEMIQLAKSILADQQAEIMEMQALLKLYPLQKGSQVLANYKSEMDAVMNKMMQASPSDNDLKDKSVDCAFAMVMLPHHQAAVDMSTALIGISPQGQVATYAHRIISDQAIEIELMQAFIEKQCK